MNSVGGGGGGANQIPPVQLPSYFSALLQFLSFVLLWFVRINWDAEMRFNLY